MKYKCLFNLMLEHSSEQIKFAAKIPFRKNLYFGQYKITWNQHQIFFFFGKIQQKVCSLIWQRKAWEVFPMQMGKSWISLVVSFYVSRHFRLMRFHLVCISSKQGNVAVIDRDSKNHSLIQFYKFLDIRSRFKLSTNEIVILLVLDSCTEMCLCFNHFLEMFKAGVLKK